MIKQTINYDFRHSLKGKRAGAGLTPAQKSAMNRRLAKAMADLKRQRDSRKIGFLEIPGQETNLAEVERLARSVARQYRTLIVIGIGGSDLGARAIISALQDSGQGMEIRFIGANTDPEEIAQLLNEVDLKRSVLNVISKSGSTVEPMSTFLLLREELIKAVGQRQHAKQVIATTDPEQGTLRQIADQEGYRTLPVPAAIGGRFSALTPVGLFPAACAGIPVRPMVQAAQAAFERFFREAPSRNQPLQFAGLHHAAWRSGWGRVAVLMPYAARLKLFGDWFVQLWAESLGKEKSRSGRTVNAGQTPVSALGATDQHSQIQLFNEGPFDKLITFIEIAKFRQDFVVPKPYPKVAGLAYLGGKHFSQIIRAERRATAEALRAHGRPSGTITVPAITPRSLGELMAFFMLATAAAGELWNVNVYDQPGVEEGKRIMYRLLGRPVS